MVSLRNGILRVTYKNDEQAKRFFDLCFVVNLVTIFALYQVRLVATVTGMMTLVAAVFIWIDRRNRRIIVPYNCAWYLVFIMYNGLSCLWSPYVSTDYLAILAKMAVILAMITAISIYVETPEDLERLMSLFTFSMTVIVLLELSSVSSSSLFSGGLGSNFSGFNSNEIAFWIVCAEMIAFYKAYIKGQNAYYILVALFLGFVLLSSSRKFTVSGIVSPILMMVITSRKKYKFLQLAAVILAGAALFYLIMTNEKLYSVVGQRFVSMLNYFSEDTIKTDGSMELRNYYIEVAKELFGQSPVVGKGMATYGKILSAYYEMNFAYTHNNYWQILSELGIVGFVLYYSFYVFMIVKLVKNIIVNKSRIAIMFLTFMVILLIIEWGVVTLNTKTAQIIIAIAYTSTYVGESDGRLYGYIENNTNELEENKDE